MEFIQDDGGRFAAGFRGEAGDCVTRAIAIATGKPYREIYDRLAHGNATQRRSKHSPKSTGKRSARNGISTTRKWFKDYMKELGFEWTPTMKVGQGCKVHLREDELPKGRLVVSVSKHMTAVIDGKLHDTYDCSRDGTRCVYGYYKLKELPKPVTYDSRISFGISYFDSEDDADCYAEHIRKRGATYNGGFYHGRPCGRDESWDYFDKDLGKTLYAVTE